MITHGEPAVDAARVEAAFSRLAHAVTAGHGRGSCLRRWSEFIRLRDGLRCVDCHARSQLSAHHICRKSFIAHAQFDTGNGITLCRECHRDAHRGFNGSADLGLPVDAQDGEKLALMQRFYSILLDDAIERGMFRDEYYHLGDRILGSLRRMQGFGDDVHFPGSRLEQAFLIIAETERPVLEAFFRESGVTLGDTPLLPGGVMLIVENEDGSRSPVIVRNYRCRTPQIP